MTIVTGFFLVNDYDGVYNTHPSTQKKNEHKVGEVLMKMIIVMSLLVTIMVAHSPNTNWKMSR